MLDDDRYWGEHYQANLDACAEIDRTGAEAVLRLLPGSEFVKGEDRAMQVRLLSSTVAAFEGEYGWSQNYGWPTSSRGLLSLMFLDFAVKNLPPGGGAAGRALRRQVIEIAIKSAGEHALDPEPLIKIATDNGMDPDEIDELVRRGEANFYNA